MKVTELLKCSEGKTLEFKRDLSSPKKLLKTLVAFANTAGGVLLIGIEDKTHEVIGVDNPLDEEERLCNLVADSIRPRLVPNIEMTTIDGKTVLIAEVFLSALRPRDVKAEGPESGVYVRLGSSNRPADRELIAELKRSVEGRSFDEMPMPDLSPADIDIEAAQRAFLNIREIDESALISMKLLSTEQGKNVPSKGGVLLFGRERNRYFSDCWVQCGRFIGTDKAEIFDHIEIDEALPQAIDSIMLFLKKHAMRGADFSDTRRKDVWSIPLKALREAVINAVVHADYSQRGAPIRVAFFDDRIEIENPGLLMPGLTFEDMKRGLSKIRNPVIARVFRELNLIEQWGSGIPRIFRETAALGLPEPRLIELAHRLRFVFPLAQPIMIQALADDKKTVKPSGLESGGESGGESAMALKILNALQKEPLSKAETARKLGKAQPTRYVHDLMASLVRRGMIGYTIPEKPNSRLQKYRLTAKGHALLEKV